MWDYCVQLSSARPSANLFFCPVTMITLSHHAEPKLMQGRSNSVYRGFNWPDHHLLYIGLHSKVSNIL